MQIIELTETQFRNYSRLHSKKNYKQSIEYAAIKKNKGFNPLYLGLIDNSNNVHAATLILEKNINNKHKYGIVPKSNFSESFSSSNTYEINQILSRLLRKFYLELENFSDDEEILKKLALMN